MKRSLLAAVLFVITMTSAVALDRLTPQEVAALPQDKVVVVKKRCAGMFPDDFSTRLYCEDSEYIALKKLIDRGSVSPKGERL
jgi:opacity protein-like surface antigen